MALAINIFGQRYDNAVPCFLEAGEDWFNRIDSKTYDGVGLDEYATSIGYTFPAGERGPAPQDYADAYIWPAEDAAAGTTPPPVVVQAPITATVTKTPSATADDTGEITIAGGPADKAYAIHVHTKDATSSGEDIQDINVAQGDVAEDVATAVATAISDPNVTATAAGAVVTIKPASGSTLETLSVTVS